MVLHEKVGFFRVFTPKGKCIKVDYKDFVLFNSRSWYITNNGYVQHFVWRGRSYRPTMVRTLFHRELMDTPQGLVCDHINGDPLDNRRSNLRICTQKDNVRNSRHRRTAKKSNYKGIVKTDKIKKPFLARIKVDGKPIHLGYFVTELEAAGAYDVAAKLYFGEYARTNLP